LDAPYGHDSFLVESDRLFEIIAPFIEKWGQPVSNRPERRAKPNSKPHSIRVLKFGGSSVGRPESIRRVVEVVGKSARKRRVIVVASALSEVTNILEQILADGQTDRTALLLGLYRRHIQTARQLLSDLEFRTYRNALSAKLSATIPARRRLQQNVHKRFDMELILAAGERFSVPLIAAALREEGFTAVPVDGAELIRMSTSSDGSVDLERTAVQIKAWYESIPGDRIPIVTGFIGASDCGNTVTLGRGGSDFTAALLSSALDAELMERWTDVDGLFTSDPNRDLDASRYNVLSMDDADLLNRADRLGMHRHTLTPLIASRIPLRVRSIHSTGPGTLVIPTSQPSHTLQAAL
jgi:aspartate kinase